ncbi:hypothetical protein G5S42_16035 [Paraburkholderia sp. JPY169]|uniref:Uncharacterized protein n=2 Tax=Burkholderiaceae TaxID=119060 RepID=A0A7Y6JYN4_9BURK|nr:hypothetical protein [Paraburkholderia youngii]
MRRGHRANRQDARGAKMSLTSRQTAAQRGGRLPARFADSHLQHLESVLGYATRKRATQSGELDHVYWERRIRALEDTHHLVESQRSRIAKLRGMLR